MERIAGVAAQLMLQFITDCLYFVHTCKTHQEKHEASQGSTVSENSMIAEIERLTVCMPLLTQGSGPIAEMQSAGAGRKVTNWS